MPGKKDDGVEPTRKSNGIAPLMAERQMALVAEAHLRLFKRMEDVSQAWMESVRRVSEAETEFAHGLKECREPAKAAELCAEWLAACANALLAGSQRFTGLWFSYCSEALTDTWSVVAQGERLSHEMAAPRQSSER
jgi:hypothetical protein